MFLCFALLPISSVITFNKKHYMGIADFRPWYKKSKIIKNWKAVFLWKKNFLLLISWGYNHCSWELNRFNSWEMKGTSRSSIYILLQINFPGSRILGSFKIIFEQVPTGAFAFHSFSLNFGEQIVKTIDLFCVKPLEIILKAKVSCRNFFCIRKTIRERPFPAMLCVAN